MSLPMGQFGASSPPQSLLDYYSSVEQGSNRRFDQGLAAQAKQAKAQLDNQYRIAKLQASTAAEQLAVDKWYKEQQVQLAQKTFDENIRQFDKTYGLQEADTTGWFGGKATLAREAQDAKLTGMYGGQQTLEAKELERRFGLAEGTLTGTYGGQQTLEAQELARRFGLDQSKFGLDQSKFGLDVAKTAADLRSRPDMLFQYGEFARNLPGLLQGQGGQRYGGAPQGQTIAGQLQEVGYGPPGGGDPSMRYARGGPVAEPMLGITDPGFDPGAAAQKARGLGMSPDLAYLSAAAPGASADPTLAAIGRTYQAGFDKLGAQTLESMDPNDRGFLKSGGTFQGFDYDRELRKYAGSRLGQ